MALAGIRSKLNNMPVWAIALVAVAMIGVALWVAISRGGGQAYAQPDIHVKCTDCGYDEGMSAAEYQERINKELPGASALQKGGLLFCPACGKHTLKRVEASATTP